MKNFRTNISLNKNSLLNGKIDPQTSLPTTNLYEGRIITHQGEVYIYYNGSWLSKSEISEKAELANLAILAKKAELAEDLVGRPEVYIEDFTFQPTANTDSVRDGLATIKSIKGNTVVVNQFIPTTDKYTANANSSMTILSDIEVKITPISNTTNAGFTTQPQIKTVVNHKYFISFDIKGDASYTSNFLICNWSFGAISINVTETYQKQTYIYECVESHSIGFFIRLSANAYYLKNYILIDLTQMFGAGNEPTIEKFEKLYPNLQYNKGSLLNLNADSIKSVGFNAFNGDYAQVLGGLQYYLGGNITSLKFKESLNSEEDGVNIAIPSDKLFTPNTNGYLFATGTDICINLSHSGYRNGEYEPYKESIAKLPITEYFTDGMKSVGDVRDEIIYNGNTEYKAIKRIGSRAYQTGDEDLADVRTDKTNTYYILETPEITIIDYHTLIEYEVSDFGSEEIISRVPTTPIIAEIQYGFNAVDVIRNNLFNIKELFKLLLTKLSLTGGTMSGAIDMSSNPFINARFEPVEILPTDNNSVGRQVFQGKPYWWNGKEWITFPENSGGGEPTGDFWKLLEANPEVIASSYLPADDSMGVFEYLFNQGELKKSRDIVVDFSRYQGGRIFRDFFSAYIDEVYAVFPYEWAYEQETDLRYTRFKVMLTNNPFTYPIAIMVPDSPIIKTNFSEVMTGMEYPNEEQARYFYLYPNSSVMVDFELQQHENSEFPILVNITAVSSFGTATFDSQRCSTQENQTAINNYLDANNIPYSINKATGEILYNAQDLLASICSKLK